MKDDSNRNVFTSRAMWGGAPSCTKVTTGNTCLSGNAGRMWSHKCVRYRSAETVQVFWPDTGQGYWKKKDPRIKDPVKLHQTVTWGECKGWLWYSRGFDASQIRLFCVLKTLCSKKWALSAHMTFSIHYGLHSFCASTHVANFCLCLLVTNGEVPGFYTDTDLKLNRAEYFESTVPKSFSPSLTSTATPRWCLGYQIFRDIFYHIDMVRS